MKILTIVGARPQFIKAGSVSRAIREWNKKNTNVEIKEVIVHTGQHYDKNMSDVFFEELYIPKPNYFLGIGGKSHGVMTGEMLIKIEEVLLKEKPDWVMVYGDTNSTIAGALAASKLHIKVAHVEAGLRSFNMNMPEEVNRVLTDRISNILFCPTQIAVDNLEKEGYFVAKRGGGQKEEGGFGKVVKVGDVMQEGALFYKRLATKPSALSIQPLNYILSTVHRAENTDDPERLKSIFTAFNEIAKEVQIVLPLHPRTKALLPASIHLHPNIILIDPVGYLEMMWLIDNCKLVMTDSGGLQKEAYFFKKACITLRDETEWTELVEVGANVLVGADKQRIISAYKEKANELISTPVPQSTSVYGDGRVSEKIINELLSYE